MFRIEISNLLYALFISLTDVENILLCDRGLYPTVKIADLGLAKIEAASKANTLCGSPGYLAPECTQVSQAQGLNWAMDIYAVGVISYEMYPSLLHISNSSLTGKCPFSTNLNENPYNRRIPTASLRLRSCSDAAMDFMNLVAVHQSQRTTFRTRFPSTPLALTRCRRQNGLD